MKRTIGTMGGAMLLMLAIPSLGEAQTQRPQTQARPAAAASGTQARPAAAASSSQAPSKSMWQGVYTEAQAKRGDTVRQRECAACHGQQEWSRPAFLASWYGRSTHDLFQQIKSTMPYDGPGRLPAQEYADIVAYMLKLHGAPAGQTELKGDDASLRQVLIHAKGEK